MALATQCPHCHTTFRVAHDQLKLRAGLVRCGACKQIFNGIENLLRPEDIPPAPGAKPVTPAVAPAPSADSPAHDTPAPPPPSGSMPDEYTATFQEPAGETHALPSEPAAEASAASVAESEGETDKPDNPLLRMTLMDFAHARPEAPAERGDESPSATSQEENDDPVEQAIDELQRKPWRRRQQEAMEADADPIDAADADGYEEPSFVRQGRRRQRLGRAMRIFMAPASVILLLTLFAQGVYTFRDQIAASYPQIRPALAEACSFLGCQMALPARIDAVSVESSELQALSPNGNTFSLSVLLRNHASTAQAWPNLELTLNDSREKPLVRRVFLPREYLGNPQDIDKGFPAQSEQSIKLFFELAQTKASGYRVYVFYP